MLLPSERHRPEDLEWWARQERLDKLHGLRLQRAPKVQAALAELREFAEAGPCYLGTSWGKDSVVALHLAVLAGLDVPVVHIVQQGPQHDPYQEDVRDAFLERFDVDYHEVVVEVDNLEQAEDEKAPSMVEGIRRIHARWGRRWISGIRADESGARKARARKGMTNSCWPIRWWSADDVYGWLAVHGLPVHPSYAMTRGGLEDRAWIRVSILGGQKGRGMGRLQWERYYYPDVLARLGM